MKKKSSRQPRRRETRKKAIQRATELKSHDTEIQGELGLGSKFLGFACTAGQQAPVQYGSRYSETHALGEARQASIAAQGRVRLCSGGP